MKLVFKIARVLLVAGLATLTMGVLLTCGGPTPGTYGPNAPALLSLFIGSLLLWAGCIGAAVALPLRWVTLAGVLSVAASLMLPWVLHAMGVTWWSQYRDIPHLAVLLAGLIQLAAAVIRFLLSGIRRVEKDVGLRTRPSLRYLRAAIMGAILGYLAFLGLARHYEPASVLVYSCAARFDWDSTHGVKGFQLENSSVGGRRGGRIWQSLVAVQIKPALDSYLRLAPFPRATGWAGVHVARVIPFALPGSWGSGGMHWDTDVTPLMRAAEKGDLDSVERLLAGGPDVNARDWMGKTALLHSCENVHMDPQLIAILLAAGANPNLADRGGKTPLMSAALGLGGEDKAPARTALRELIGAGANANARTVTGGTALMDAAGEGDIEAVELLLKAGADVAAQTDGGRTALSLAQEYNRLEVVQILKKAGAHD